MFGILNLDKPTGWTSRQVVDHIARAVRPAKAGHAGTLDPLARGVLLVCVGPATRLVPYLQRMPKQYRATFLLGRISPTEDVEGEVELLADPPIPSLSQWVAAAQTLTGTITQRPPAYSALKLGGERAYRLARRGESVELTPRPVEIYELNVLRYEYPELELDISCGGGTYVRSLGRDLAESLGTGAVMSALARTAIGSFHLADAVSPAHLTREEISQRFLAPLQAVEQLPKRFLSGSQLRDIGYGRPIDGLSAGAGEEEIAALDEAGNLVAILGRLDARRWRVLIHFPQPS